MKIIIKIVRLFDQHHNVVTELYECIEECHDIFSLSSLFTLTFVKF